MSSDGKRDFGTKSEIQAAVVEIAKRVISGDLGIIAGCRDLTQLDHVVEDWRVDPDFVVFGAVASETDDLPLEGLRALWQPAAFAEKQIEVARFEAACREEVFRACRSVLDRFGPAAQDR